MPGEAHLRTCTWGGETRAGLIESAQLDWRFDPSHGARPADVDADTAGRLADLNRRLDLEMSIGDLKPAGDGGPRVFLEINPQGQFLFLEGLSGDIELARPFARFLLDRANGGIRPPWAARRAG